MRRAPALLSFAALLPLAALLTGLAPAPAPVPPRLMLYADRFYRGAVQTFTADVPRLADPIEPQSLRLTGRWQVCTEADFGGRCIEIDRDYAVGAGLGDGFAVQSLRQLSAGEGAGQPTAGAFPGGASIIGVASRYWPAPTYGDARVLACPKGKPDLNCAHDTAEALCRRAGYRVVRYWQLQTVGTNVYLADILCTRSDDT